jgi:spore maturation protein A
MLNYIWAGMMLISLISAAVLGKMEELTQAVMNGGKDAVSVCLTLLASLCLWGGMLKIAQAGGLTKIIAKIFSPVLKRLFNEKDADSKAMQAISMNVTANLLGLGNAATPLGIAAMRELAKETDGINASNKMVTFVLLNTASLHLVPTTAAMLRTQHGSVSPMDIFLPALTASALALAAGLAGNFLLKKREN